MDQDIIEWLLLFARWIHITVGITWIGTSIFFMWLDRSLVKNPSSSHPGHVGDLWMVHGGGFYHVEKLLMGSTEVPKDLHWFKWESYWTWMSGIFLLGVIFYAGNGTFLLDASVSKISFIQALGLSVASLVVSWLFYDFLWESELARKHPKAGHALTLLWFGGMVYLLCHTLSGRAAYIHIGGMLGTWMTANVFLRIIPRQVLMVEAAKRGESVNPDWGRNAKNRSTHNTYFTLPVIFIMLSNHFPTTYGSPWNWQILIAVSAAGAAIREFFVVRLSNPPRSRLFGAVGAGLLLAVMVLTHPSKGSGPERPNEASAPSVSDSAAHPQTAAENAPATGGTLHGYALFEGPSPDLQKLSLPAICNPTGKAEIFANDILIRDGKIQNVLIRVVQGMEGKTFTDIPPETALLDQKDCQYEPRLIAVRVGQKLDIVNSDATFHNVKTNSKSNETFNLAMPGKNDRITRVFQHPEIFIESECSVHPWMSASIAVMDHPFFGVTDAKGEFTLRNLPPGTYTLEAWHEVFGTRKMTVTVKGLETQELNFIFNR